MWIFTQISIFRRVSHSKCSIVKFIVRLCVTCVIDRSLIRTCGDITCDVGCALIVRARWSWLWFTRVCTSASRSKIQSHRADKCLLHPRDKVGSCCIKWRNQVSRSKISTRPDKCVMYRRSSLYAKANASINCRYNYCTIMFIRFYDSLTLSSIRF